MDKNDSDNTRVSVNDEDDDEDGFKTDNRGNKFSKWPKCHPLSFVKMDGASNMRRCRHKQSQQLR